MRKKFLTRAVILALSLSLVACATPPTKEDVGTVLGGVGGGVIGAQVGGGHGRTAAIIAGSILGAILGKEVGKSMDRTDELMAAHVLEVNKTGQSSTWINPDTQNQVTVTPERTYQKPTGQYCREYQTQVVVGGKTEQAYGTACRQPDGSWKIVNQN